MKYNKLIIAMALIFALTAVSLAAALPVTIDKVKIDGDEISPTSADFTRSLDRDNSFEIKVQVTAQDDVNDAQIEVYLRGYDHPDLIQDISDVFDMRANRTYVKTFQLTFPYKLDKDQYKLRVRVEDRDGDSTEENYELGIESERHDMIIKDVLFSPSDSVVAGRSLLTSVRIENTGMTDPEEGVKVMINIPNLGISAADYIDQIDEDQSTTSEELYLRIPECTKAGTYDAVITVTYHDGDKVSTMNKKVTITEGELCQANAGGQTTQPAVPKTIITVGSMTQDVTQGQGGVIYPLTISNAGTDAKTYVITADGYADWADISMNPANIVVLQPGDAKVLYIYVSAHEDASVGQHMFLVSVGSGTETLKQFSLTANVVQGEQTTTTAATDLGGVKRVLEIGLIVLVVLLVILGLIIGFSRLRGRDEDLEDEEGKSETYY